MFLAINRSKRSVALALREPGPRTSSPPSSHAPTCWCRAFAPATSTGSGWGRPGPWA